MRKKHLSEINVTPFVDVVLVLLVIFMATAPLVYSKISVQLPEVNAGTAIDEKPEYTYITINLKKEIFLDDKKISLEEFRKKPKDQLYIKADKNLHYGEVLHIMNELKKAGAKKIHLMTKNF